MSCHDNAMKLCSLFEERRDPKLSIKGWIKDLLIMGSNRVEVLERANLTFPKVLQK